MKKLLFWRGVFALVLVFVTWLTVTPNPEDAEHGMALMRWLAEVLLGNPAVSDKVGHFSAYGVLGACACWAQLSPFSKQWAVPASLALYGAALEGAQAFGGVRTPELADAFANATGALIGFAVGIFLMRLVARKPA